MTGKDRILKLLITNPLPLSDEEIASKLRMNPSSARTRRCELEREGSVLAVGYTETKAGRRTFLWTAADHVWDTDDRT